jgi:hypothetical protein
MLGNSLGGLFGGGSSAAPEPATQATSAQNNNSWGNNCVGATEQFTKCMDEQQGNMSICGWYLEQLVGFVSFPFLSLGGERCADFCVCVCRKRARLLLASTKLMLADGGGEVNWMDGRMGV